VLHAASNGFARAGLREGDRLYIVHYESRELFLGARLTVDRNATKSEAASALGMSIDEVWDARDHVLAVPDTVQRLDPDRLIPRTTLNDLTLVRADGAEAGVKIDPDGAANQQTVRSVRELTTASAGVLDDLIGWDAVPTPRQVMSIALRRGPCFGTCPVYVVAFFRDGLAEWRGAQFVDRIGPHAGTVPDADVQRLFEMSIDVGFFQLDDDYPPWATDLPDYTLQVTTGIRDKEVRAWGGSEPEPFRMLSDAVDRVAAAIGWEPASDDRPGR
jgi:hypothetical protein